MTSGVSKLRRVIGIGCNGRYKMSIINTEKENYCKIDSSR